MNPSAYQKAKDQGYSDEEIINFLSKKDPKISEKIKVAQQQNYSLPEVVDYLSKSKKEEPSPIKEIPQQAAKGTTSGALGTYGDILDFLGVQPTKQLPGEKSQFQREFSASPEELPHLVETEDILPRYSKLPSSEDVSEFIEEVGGPGKPQTMPGRYASRTGRLVGSTAVLGGPAITGPIVAGTAGQTLEELGAPPWAQAAAEIIAFAKVSKSKTPLTSKSPEIQNQLKNLEKQGYTTQDLTLAKNALEDRGFLKKVSRFTPEAEKKFQKTLKSSEDIVHSKINEAFPGIEKGLTNLKQESANIYNSIDDISKSIVIKKPQAFIRSSLKAINSLKKSLANTPQEKQVISLLEKSIYTAKPKPKPGIPQSEIETNLLDQFGNKTKKIIAAVPEEKRPFPTADYYINFYQGLNQIGNWSSPKQRENVFRIVKDSVKDAFREQGPEGQKLANLFEEANESWKKFRQAEDVTGILEKAITEEGINFKKLNSILDKPDNFESFSQGLGLEQAKNLKQIAKVGSEIDNLQKIMKGGTIKEAMGAGKLYNLVKGIVTLDWRPLAGYAGHSALGRISTKFLINPSYQNIQIRMMNALKEGKYDQLRVLAKNLEKKMEKDDLIQADQ